MIAHTGRDIPHIPTDFDPDSTRWLSLAWDDYLDGRTIESSQWVLPTGWELIDERVDLPVQSNGARYDHVNRALLRTRHRGGQHTITNRVTLSDQSSDDRSVVVNVAQT